MYSSQGLQGDPYMDQDENDSFGHHGDEERTQLLLGTRALNRASASLHRAQQVSAHTDEIAVEAMGDLQNQKTQLVRTKNRLSDVDGETERSRVLVSTIACQALQNRIMLVIIIILEVVILLGVLSYKLYKRF